LALERGIQAGWRRFLVAHGYERGNPTDPVMFRFAGLEFEQAQLRRKRAAKCG
jgi:hypothetical protein